VDLRQLAALVAVADHRSFSAAARALYTVQSNVSAHIAHLERELGVQLVDRSRGRLTPEGEVVVARARRIQREVEAVTADVSSLGQEVAGEAHLGLIGTTARWLAPQLLPALHAQHPKVRVVILEASTTSLIPQLVAGQLDLAVVNLPVTDPEVDTSPLFDEELVLLALRSSPLAERSELSIVDLANEPLVLPPPGTALRHDLDAESRRAGVTLRALAEIDGVHLMTSLAFEGLGATIVPTTAVPGWLKGDFVRIPIVDLARRHVGLARRRRAMPSACARAVADVLHEVIATRGPKQRGVRTVVEDTALAGSAPTDDDGDAGDAGDDGGEGPDSSLKAHVEPTAEPRAHGKLTAKIEPRAEVDPAVV
jgi:DNA-binding transcriptional LysR family regulator